MNEKNVRVERTTVVDMGDGISAEYNIYVGEDNMVTLSTDDMINLQACIEKLLEQENRYQAIEADLEKGGRE